MIQAHNKRGINPAAWIVFSFFWSTAVILSAAPASAAVSLPYSTSFSDAGCVEGLNLFTGSGCSGLQAGGNGGGCPLDSMVYAEANNPLGPGRGVRHFVNDGKNVQGRTFSVNLSKLHQELWIRFYIKYPPGFKWNYLQEHKLLWIAGFLPGTNARVFSLAGGDRFRFWNQRNTDGNEVVYSAPGNGWNVLSDGKWHAVEAHVKYGALGEEHIWVDGKQILSKTGVSMVNDQGGFGWIEFGTNADAPGNGGCIGYDVDDIAISSSGYIGLLDSSSCTPAWNCTAWSDCHNDIQTRTCVDSNDCGAADGWPALTQTCLVAPVNVQPRPSGLLFSENFDDSSLSARGWYDNTSPVLSGNEHIVGSSRSVEFRFTQGATKPINGGAMRKKFGETDSVYLSYWVKYSSNWTGSNKNYHPHEFYFITNKNDDWVGPAYTRLTAYVEQNEGMPLFAFQDGMNIDRPRLNQDLSTVTENRAVCGCNGVSTAENASTISCYPAGEVYWNGKVYKAGTQYFQDHSGPYYKNDWHLVEAYIKLNTIQGGKGQADGIILYWYDNQPIIERTNIVMRTAANPDMKFNQFLIAPWIGDGSPLDQTFWIDDLTVATGYTGSVSAKKGDLNNSGLVDVTDLGIFLSNWGSVSKPASDLNQDGKVDVTDLGILLGNWG